MNKYIKYLQKEVIIWIMMKKYRRKNLNAKFSCLSKLKLSYTVLIMCQSMGFGEDCRTLRQLPYCGKE